MGNVFKRFKINTYFMILHSALFIFAGTIFVLVVNYNMRQQALFEAEEKARLILDSNLAIHTYFTHKLKPHLFEMSSGIYPASYFEPLWMSSTFAVREIDKYFKSLGTADYYYKECAINARSPENEADAYEKAFLKELNENPHIIQRSEIRVLEGEKYFTSLRRGEVMEESCLRCHTIPARAPEGLVKYYGKERSFNRNIGEVISAISIRVPLSAAYTEVNRLSLRLSASLLATLVLFYGVQVWFRRRLLLSPLNIIRKKAILISTDHKHLGEEISMDSAQELNELAAAFNTMSLALHKNRENLEQQVRERTDDLRKTNRQLQQEIAERRRTETELIKTKEKAEIANHAKSDFLANMSHELRSPLNAILGFTRVIERNRAIPAEEKENLTIIRRSGEHLLNLINDVLDMSKIEAGRTVLTEKDFDIYRLLDDAENMFCLRAGEKGIQLFFERDPDVPRYVRADEGKLRQVLVNLLGNAIRFTGEGGVSVRVRQVAAENRETKKTDLQFEIEDSGEGIASDDLDSIFDAFIQTESGRNSQEGTGLGLPISRKFVKMMGGDITVESRLGRGSVFRFQIRAEAAEGPETETMRPERRVIALEADHPCQRILIADDRENNRTLLVRLLTLPGIELREAKNGRDAVDIWEKWRPHLICMDMRMPVMDGYEATKTIKGTAKGQSTVIIAVTASIFEDERASVLSAGCDDFIRKPFKDFEIFDAIRKHLGVRYVYEQDGGEAARVKEQNMAESLIPLALAALPPGLRDALENAVAEIDRKRIDGLLAEIRSCHAALADALAGLAADYRYEEILNLIHETEKETDDV